MNKPKNPLEPLERAQEESYFHRQDQKLIEQMREKLARERSAADIKAETGLADDALVARLAELGVEKATIPVLHLVPLLQVAWADGEIQAGERELLLEAAEATGVTEGAAREAFEGMLQKRPSDDYFDAAISFIRHMVAALPGGESSKAKANLVELAYKVADASGGVFGLWGRVGAEEKDALRSIAEKLTEDKGDAAAKLLGKL